MANHLGRFLLAPVGVLPGWLSATLVAGLTGVLLLAVFKYTSNQRAIQRVRNDINGNAWSIWPAAGHPAQPRRGAVPAQPTGPVDRNRLP